MTKRTPVVMFAGYLGPWWCPGCSTAHSSTMQTNHGEPCCPNCGTILEEQGTGDDATDFEEIEL